MPRGLFSQCLAILMESAPTLDDLERQLVGFEVVRRSRASKTPTWLGGFDELVVAYRPEQNGHVVIDIVDRRWPDTMGDPKSDPELFGAWSMGAFGPAAFPQNLARAQRFAMYWRDGAEHAGQWHSAFLRLRTTYLLGRDENAPVAPESRDPLDELDFLARLARACMTARGSMAFFNPGGEILLDAKELDQRRANAMAQEVPALDVHSQLRFATVGDSPEWSVMDTVGMDQLMAPDHEACFRPDDHEPNDVAAWLRNVCLYVLEAGPVIEATDTIDGPGGTWRCLATHNHPWIPAPRPVYRWHPEGAILPDELRRLD